MLVWYCSPEMLTYYCKLLVSDYWRILFFLCHIYVIFHKWDKACSEKDPKLNSHQCAHALAGNSLVTHNTNKTGTPTCVRRRGNNKICFWSLQLVPGNEIILVWGIGGFRSLLAQIYASPLKRRCLCTVESSKNSSRTTKTGGILDPRNLSYWWTCGLSHAADISGPSSITRTD